MFKYILLGLIRQGFQTGYEIKQFLDESISYFWHAHHSQIYTTLRKMEKEDLLESQLIEQEKQADRRVYSITETGEQEYKDWLNLSMTEIAPIKEELLVRLFFSGDRDKQSILSELHIQKQLHQKKIRDFEKIENHLLELEEKCDEDLSRNILFWRATLKFGFRFQESYLAWLDEVIEDVSKL